MITIKALKSEIIDEIILNIEDELKATGRHLIKTNTILERCRGYIDLHDDIPTREELLDIGMRQVIQSRLYSHGYYSIDTGYFVNVSECENLGYLKLLIDSKDGVIEKKIAARNRLKQLKELNGQMVFVPDNDGELSVVETKTGDELAADLEADAI